MTHANGVVLRRLLLLLLAPCFVASIVLALYPAPSLFVTLIRGHIASTPPLAHHGACRRFYCEK